MNIKIDFDNVYDLSVVHNLNVTNFDSLLDDQTTAKLKIEISNQSHELVPRLYNLAFGPLDQFDRIDDKAELKHADYSKTFSTILLAALTYLTQNADHYLGIDGSTETRAYLYYRVIQHNYDYLNDYFEIFGLKYYVRISRFGKKQYDNPFDFKDIRPELYRIEKKAKFSFEDLYNYFIFRKK